MSEVKVNKISPRTNCGTVTVGDSGDSVSVTAGVPVTVNGDLKSNALKAVDGGSIISQCGTTITLGASGDTINLAAGASQTGFGRTGTVNWDTTAKTASFTAVNGTGYFVDTTSGAVTMTLPASPSAGDIVSVKDYAYTFATNNFIVNRNGSPIGGGTDLNTITYSTNGDFLTFIYVDGTRGWVLTNDSTNIDATESPFIIATGGTITTSGDYKIHTFTSPGTFCVTSSGSPAGSTQVDYLVVAGGGGGGRDDGGGGGGGGYRESHSTPVSGCYTASPLATPTGITLTVTGYPITVGGGGTGDPSPSAVPATCRQGSSSIFSTITSAGGGGGARTPSSGGPGGSGGGGGAPAGPGGTGNTPPVSPPQGQPGGIGTPGSNAGAGGGGAITQGGNASGSAPAAFAGGGGQGAGTLINPATGETGPGPSQYYAGGGGGGAFACGGGSQGFGGIGGGGDGAVYPPTGCGQGDAGTANTGGGGGGGATSSGPRAGGTGGSGIVIIRYKYQ
jgi:hypothetical protein